MAVEKCKGTRDLSTKEMSRFRFVEGAFRESCLKWGYDEVRTPTLEYLYLFTAAGTLTPARLGRVYSFLDWDGWSGERVVLRPDGTIPVARYYIETTGGKGPAKLFYVGNVFSFEETGTENREKWQCGAELIGAASPAADVELVVMASEIVKKLGLGVEIRLSHAGLIRAILSKIEASAEEQARAFDRILDGDTQAFVGARPELAKILAPMLGSKGKTSGFLKNVSVMLGHDLPELQKPLADFADTAAILDSLGTPYEIDIASGRGFEYYTGLIFELWSSTEKIAGGGRYDALIPLLGGKNTPASGFAVYVDKVMELLGPGTTDGQAGEKVVVRTEPDPSALKDAFELVDALHKKGFVAEIDPTDGESSPSGARWLLEARGTGWRFSLRDLQSGNRYDAASIDEVIEHINANSKLKAQNSK
jgi:histidyl-tRNA synthetase